MGTLGENPRKTLDETHKDRIASASESVLPAAIKGDYLWPYLRPHDLIDDRFKLDENNFMPWYGMISNVIRSMSGAFIHLTKTGPEPGEPGYDKWLADDHAIILLVLDSLSPEIRSWCSVTKPAKKIWD